MTIVCYSKVPGSTKSAHQYVDLNDQRAGEVWREQVTVTVSKLTEPRRTALKWRWFAKPEGESRILGRGDRAAMLLGSGYASKDKATDALEKACAVSSN